jgi:hypothetical protein
MRHLGDLPSCLTRAATAVFRCYHCDNVTADGIIARGTGTSEDGLAGLAKLPPGTIGARR